MANSLTESPEATMVEIGDLPPAVDDEAYTPTYAEAFPPLPGPGEMEPIVNGGGAGNQWFNNNNNNNNIKLSVRSSAVTQVFSVPVEERKYKELNDVQFGEKGRDQARICNDIMAKTGVAIEMSMARDQSLTVVVTGKPDAVLRARKQITQQLQTQASVTMKIPKEHHRFIIRQKDRTVADLELHTATKISIPRVDDTSDVITITGTKDGIERARHEIQMISDEQAKLAYVRLPIEKCYHAFICGPYNRRLKELMERSKARVNIPPLSVNRDEISIAGSKEGVEIAEREIRELYEEKKQTCKSVSIEVKKSQHKYIIGPKGSNLSEILDKTGVAVEVPMLDSDSSTITLRGDADRLGVALTEVYAKANSVTVLELLVPGWLHRFIIGAKGASIKLVNQEYPQVHIEFKEEENKVILEGPPEEVEQVEKGIREKMEDLMTRMAFVDLKVDHKYHRHIIGRSGANVSRIKKETGVSIRIPPDEAMSSTIRIEGSPEGVARAKQELIEMIEKMENEITRDILIDQRFHKNFIGTQGNNIREIRDMFNQVQISFPDSSRQSDVVTLRGPKNDVDKCFKYLQQKVQEMSVSSFKAEVHIFKELHRNIIGKGGAKIKKIREETDTKIDLPTEKSDSDVIVITGKKENVEKAKNMIEAIQKEMVNISEMTIEIPQKYHTSLIGSKGRLIRSIMEECGGVQIRFPSENATSDKVMLRGPKADVEKAKKQLMDLSNERKESGYTVEVRAKPEFHRFLIGRGGSNISKVREQTGVRFVFPEKNDAKDSDPELITIIGKKEAVDKAKAELEMQLVELVNTVETEISVLPEHHRHFTARRGEIVNQIAEDCGGVMMSFPRQGSKSSRVVLKGPKDCIEAATRRINEITSDLESQVTIECVIAPKYHGHVMGSKGHRIQEITKEHNVNIKFPDRKTETNAVVNGRMENGLNASEGDKTPPDGATSPTTTTTERIVNGNVRSHHADVILITGQPKNCEAAKEAMMALVPITVEMEVPFDYHGQIIGQKGAFVRQMMDEHDVSISIPPAIDKKDSIKITGTSEKIEAAKAAIEEKVRQIEDDRKRRELKSFRVEVEVAAKHHTSLIGRRGMTISKIREKHDVNIQFPEKERGNGNRDLIVIIGLEKNAEEAKAEILEKVKDLESMFTDEVMIDRRVHPRIIGSQGRAIGRIMEEFSVEVKFPGRDAEDKDLVLITGKEDDVYDCKDHLLNLEEEYLQDVNENEHYEARQSASSSKQAPTSEAPKGRHQQDKGFLVRDAPWSQPVPSAFTNNVDEFPDLGSAAPPKPAPWWGPAKR